MVTYLFQTVWSLVTTADYVGLFPLKIDILPDQSSYNPTSHNSTTIRTLTKRAQLVYDSPDSLQDETDYLNNVFSKNNYNTDVFRRNTMGSQLSVVVAEIVMQNIDEQALATYTRTIPLGHTTLMTYSLPYTTTESMIFTNALTDRTRAYNSPRRSKKNGNIPFLDCLVTRDYSRLRRTISTENRHITRPVIIQPDLSQLYNHTDFDETSATSLRLT